MSWWNIWSSSPSSSTTPTDYKDVKQTWWIKFNNMTSYVLRTGTPFNVQMGTNKYQWMGVVGAIQPDKQTFDMIIFNPSTKDPWTVCLPWNMFETTWRWTHTNDYRWWIEQEMWTWGPQPLHTYTDIYSINAVSTNHRTEQTWQCSFQQPLVFTEWLKQKVNNSLLTNIPVKVNYRGACVRLISIDKPTCTIECKGKQLTNIPITTLKPLANWFHLVPAEWLTNVVMINLPNSVQIGLPDFDPGFRVFKPNIQNLLLSTSTPTLTEVQTLTLLTSPLQVQTLILSPSPPSTPTPTPTSEVQTSTQPSPPTSEVQTSTQPQPSPPPSEVQTSTQLSPPSEVQTLISPPSEVQTSTQPSPPSKVQTPTPLTTDDPIKIPLIRLNQSPIKVNNNSQKWMICEVGAPCCIYNGIAHAGFISKVNVAEKTFRVCYQMLLDHEKGEETFSFDGNHTTQPLIWSLSEIDISAIYDFLFRKRYWIKENRPNLDAWEYANWNNKRYLWFHVEVMSECVNRQWPIPVNVDYLKMLKTREQVEVIHGENKSGCIRCLIRRQNQDVVCMDPIYFHYEEDIEKLISPERRNILV